MASDTTILNKAFALRPLKHIGAEVVSLDVDNIDEGTLLPQRHPSALRGQAPASVLPPPPSRRFRSGLAPACR